jgi:hypothetical protein
LRRAARPADHWGSPRLPGSLNWNTSGSKKIVERQLTAYSTWQHLHRAVPLAKIDRLRRLAWLIDAVGRVPGTRFRFGLNSIIGLAPGAGDAVLTLISLYIVYEAVRLGLPRAKIVRMLANVGVEAALGAFPLVGDLLDVVWKANLRNVDIIDEHFGMVRNRG